MNIVNTSNIVIRPNNRTNNTGILEFGHTSMPCVLGRGGIKHKKTEGDSVTPVGSFEILYGFYRADRTKHISSNIKLFPIRPDFGWCDDPASPLYNRAITLPTRWNHEKLWREDNLYDICLVLNHNMHPRTRNGGSAIFFHLTSPDNKPTQGCVAITLPRMLKILAKCDRQSRLTVCP